MPGRHAHRGTEHGHVDRDLAVGHEGGVGVADVGGEPGVEGLPVDVAVAVLADVDDELGGRREAVVLLRGGLAGVGSQGGDVDEAGDLGMRAGLGDDRATP